MFGVTLEGAKKSIAAKVCDLHHHAVVHHTVGGFEATVNLNVTGMEVRHALHRGFRATLHLPLVEVMRFMENQRGGE